MEEWKRAILKIAREEMAHLASIQNLLRFIGAPLNLDREDFPFRSGLYPFRFKLERLTKDSLAKYVYAEMPADLTGDDIEEIRRRALQANVEPVNHVGPLYAALVNLFKQQTAAGAFSLKDDDLQANTLLYQAGAEWTGGRPGLIIRQLKTRKEQQDGAIPLLEAIAQQGEGETGQNPAQESHYQRFRAIYDAFPVEGAWQPSRLVPVNPNTSEPETEPEDEDAVELASGRITNRRARAWAQLLNLRYRMLLTDIAHALHLDGAPNQEPKSKILEWFFIEMAVNIKSISGFLVALPQHEADSAGPPFAAPPFELPYTMNMADSDTNRWRWQRDLHTAAQMLINKVKEFEPDLTTRSQFLAQLEQRDAAALLFAEGRITLALPTPVTPTPPSTPGLPPGVPANAKRFTAVKNILEEAVAGAEIGAHGNFWRDKTRDQFVALKVFGRPLIVTKVDGTFDENESNLVKALQGRNPFGSDTGTPGATFRRMPAGLAPVAPEKVEVIRQWIKDGCPDDANA